MIKKIICLSMIILLQFTLVSNVFAYSNTEDIRVEGFEIDEELLKAALSTDNPFRVDKNEDGILTLEEWSEQYGLTVDCEKYGVEDWSALGLLKNMNHLIIRNCDEADLSHICNSNIYEVTISTDDFKQISGLNNEELQIDILDIYTKKAFDFLDLNKCNNISKLVISAPELKNYDVLSEIDGLNSLSIAADYSNGIAEISKTINVSDLKITFNDLSNLDFIKYFPNLETVDVSNCQIEDASPLSRLEHLKYINIKNNLIKDINWINNSESFRKQLREVYLEGNPITKEAVVNAVIGFSKDTFTQSKIGKDYRFSNDLLLDIIDFEDISITSNNENIVLPQMKFGKCLIQFLSVGQTQINLLYKNEIIASYDVSVEERIKGDLNKDNILSADDALALLKHVAKISELDEEQLTLSDMNEDGIITADDALEILKIVAKIK